MNTNYTKIKTFAAACKAEGLNAKSLIAKWTANGDTPDEIAYKQLKIFNKAINGDWTADFDNRNQLKYYPFFYKRNNGFVLYDVRYTCDRTFVGSRLCFETREQAAYAATCGIKMYNAFLK